MSTAVPKRRVLEKFTDQAGVNAFEFPETEREWSSEQPFSTPITTAIGADYGFDHLGFAPSPRRPAVEKVRFVLVNRRDLSEEVDGVMHYQSLDLQLDHMHSRLHRNGLGKLWMYIEPQPHVHSDGSVHLHAAERRWAHARMTRHPDTTLGIINRRFAPVSLEFARMSDWYSEDEVVEQHTISASPQTIEVINTGTTPVRALTIELRSNGANGYANPTVLNQTTGESFQVLRTGSNNNHRERMDAGRFTVERSIDGGTTWVDDYSSLSIGSEQAAMMTLAQGANYLQVSQPSGTPNFTLVIRYYTPYL